LGIGVRVAGRIVGQRVAGPASVTSRSPQRQAAPATLPSAANLGQTAAQFASHAGRGVSQGVGGFVRSFRRVGGILWLEVTGAFFLLPVIVFGPTLWKASVSYSHTTDHRTFWASAIIVPVFLYLSISSFWQARRR
jgi:hypothetical protein